MALIIASVASTPVSRARSLWVRCPQRYMAPVMPAADATPASEATLSKCRRSRRMAHGVGTLGIGNEESGRNTAHGNQPLGVGGLQPEWTGPDVLLIFGQMSQEVRLVRMKDGTIDRDSGGLRGRLSLIHISEPTRP